MAAAPVRGQTDLLDCIEWQSVECLNEKPSNTYANALKQGYREDDGLALESDEDEQLLLYIPFNQVVKLHSFIIKAPAESGPKKIKLFTNKPSIGFSEASEGLAPAQEITLKSEDLQGAAIPLKYVKFQNVRSVTLFVESNQEETETTKITKISIIGTTVETTNMSELKKIEHEH